jgi:hypothetical protein
MIKAFDELEWIKNFFDNGVDLNNEGIDRVAIDVLTLIQFQIPLT